MPLALRTLSALAIALWLGAMFFFSSGVAPVAFHVLPTHTLAGNLVDGSMRYLHQLVYVLAAILIVCLALRAWLFPAERKLRVAELVVALVMLGVALYSGLGVTPPMAEIRATVPTLDALAPTDPVRARFDGLHQLSVALMGFNLLAGLVLVVLEQLPGRREA